MKTNRGWVLLAVVGAVFLGGCARYQYVLVEPSEHRQTITKQGSVVPMPPLEYALAVVAVRQHPQLAMRIINQSSEPIRLVGERGFVVDPTGATHPLPAGTIAPNAHIGLFLPPAPVVYRSSPRFSLGLGYGHYHGPYDHMYGGLAYDPWLYGPMEFYAVNPPHHWEWKTGVVRMRLFYEDKGTNFEHNFTFDRQRAK